MSYTNFENLVKNRQSCRNFSNKPVENEKLEKIMKLALLAPSACNSQPWSFDVVNSPEISPQVAKATQSIGMNKHATNCPAFIVVCEERANLTERVGMKIKDADFVSNDIGIVTTHIILAAQSLDLCTCVLGWLNQKELSKILGHNKNKRVKLVIAIGYADEKNILRAKKRKEHNQIVRYHN